MVRQKQFNDRLWLSLRWLFDLILCSIASSTLLKYMYLYIYICIHNNLEDLKFTVGTAVQVSQNHGFQYRDHRRFAPDSGIERKFPFRPSKDRISENCIAPSYDREEATKSPKCKIKPTPEWAVFAGTKCSAPASVLCPFCDIGMNRSLRQPPNDTFPPTWWDGWETENLQCSTCFESWVVLPIHSKGLRKGSPAGQDPSYV